MDDRQASRVGARRQRVRERWIELDRRQAGDVREEDIGGQARPRAHFERVVTEIARRAAVEREREDQVPKDVAPILAGQEREVVPVHSDHRRDRSRMSTTA
ncbi:hypothetical protein [Actinomadura sp. KC345]|uniref:hypothetical protein n=1 Tax=Actinomadura sp. KC345 TaxID=2530371 RepID=UPI00326174D3